VKRRLEADDGREALGAVADPPAHQAIQLPRADTAVGGQFGRLQTSARSLELGEDRRHDRVNGGMLQPLDQKLLERRDVLGAQPPRHLRERLAGRGNLLGQLAVRDPDVHAHAGGGDDLLDREAALEDGRVAVNASVSAMDSIAARVDSISSRALSLGEKSQEIGRILEVIETDGLMEHATEAGRYLQARLEELAAEFPELVRDVRGRGLMRAFSLPSGAQRDELIRGLWDRHVVMLASGADSVRFRPALTVSYDDIDAAVAAVRDALT
jgi:hypothetical protein